MSRDAFIAAQLLESSVGSHRSYNRGQNAAKISPRPLHPHPIHYQTNPKGTQTAASNTSLPRSLTLRHTHTGFGILSRQETSEMETCALFYLCPSPIMQSTRRNRGAASRRAPKYHCDFENTAGSELRGANVQHLDVNTRCVPRFKVRVVFPLFKFEADTIRGSGNS